LSSRRSFWTLPTVSVDDEVQTDGEQWIIESRRGQRYHVVERWSPGGEFKDLGELFLEAAGYVRPRAR